MNRHRHPLFPVLLSSLLALATGATAKPPTFADQVAAIEAAEATELARLDAAMADADSQAEVILLQRCASYVKLVSRLALCEAQRARVASDPAARDVLATQIEELQERVEAQEPTLPADYRFTPGPDVVQEVPACDD